MLLACGSAAQDAVVAAGRSSIMGSVQFLADTGRDGAIIARASADAMQARPLPDIAISDGRLMCTILPRGLLRAGA